MGRSCNISRAKPDAHGYFHVIMEIGTWSVLALFLAGCLNVEACAQTVEEAIEHLASSRTSLQGRAELRALDRFEVIPALVLALRENDAFKDYGMRNMVYQMLRDMDAQQSIAGLDQIIVGLSDPPGTHFSLLMLLHVEEEHNGRVARAVTEFVSKSVSRLSTDTSRANLSELALGLRVLVKVGDSSKNSLPYLYELSRDTKMRPALRQNAARAALYIGGISSFANALWPPVPTDVYSQYMLRSVIQAYGINTFWTALETPKDLEALSGILFEPLSSQSSPHLEYEISWGTSTLRLISKSKPKTASRLSKDWIVAMTPLLENHPNPAMRLNANESHDRVKPLILEADKSSSEE